MKERISELICSIKGVKPHYFIQYTVQDGEIIILEARKTFPIDGKEYPDLIWGDAMAELKSNEEVIAKYEKDGISWEKAKEFRERWE